MFRSFFILFSTHEARFLRGSYILFFLLIWLLLSGCLFILLGSSEFVFYFVSVRVISSGHCCMYLCRIFVRSAWLSMRLSSFSLCFVLFAMLRCFERIRLFEGLSCSTHVKSRLRLSFCGEFSFFFCSVYLFRTSLSSVFVFRSFSFCLFDPSVPQCRLSYEIYAVDSFRASVSSLSGILIFSARLLGIVGVTSLVLILISLSFGS